MRLTRGVALSLRMVACFQMVRVVVVMVVTRCSARWSVWVMMAALPSLWRLATIQLSTLSSAFVCSALYLVPCALRLGVAVLVCQDS